MNWILSLHNRTQLFAKVLVVNGAIIVIGAAAALTVSHYGLFGPRPMWEFIGMLVLGLAVSFVLNFFLLRLAFRPLFKLQEVMEAVRRGEFSARSPDLVGDPDVQRLSETFNMALDRLEEYRRSVSSRILRALEEERKRIARELHDETSQALSSVIINLEVVEQGLADDHPMKERVHFVRDYTIRTLDEIRRLMYDLRPSILDDLGLVPALRWYVKNRFATPGLSVTLKVNDDLEGLRLPEETEVAVFRIVQEALTNVRRHARAGRVTVRMWVNTKTLRAEIVDDGDGFDVEEVLSRASGDRGLGLFGMMERAALIGGEARVGPGRHQGTLVEVEVPVPAREVNHHG